MKQRKRRKQTQEVMLKWIRGEFDMPFYEWARRFLWR